jgi:hypothetical protein
MLPHKLRSSHRLRDAWVHRPARLSVPFARLAGWGTAGAGPNPALTTFLFGTVEALAAGLTVSTVRWLLLDTIHHRTGIRPPAWDFASLEKWVAAFGYLIQIHYRYYKLYANMVVALIWRIVKKLERRLTG